MNTLIALAAESFLRSSLEAFALQARMDVEGRTELSAEEGTALQSATDAEARMARIKGARL